MPMASRPQVSSRLPLGSAFTLTPASGAEGPPLPPCAVGCGAEFSSAPMSPRSIVSSIWRARLAARACSVTSTSSASSSPTAAEHPAAAAAPAGCASSRRTALVAWSRISRARGASRQRSASAASPTSSHTTEHEVRSDLSEASTSPASSCLPMPARISFSFDTMVSEAEANIFGADDRTCLSSRSTRRRCEPVPASAVAAT
eukprot:scaffold15055_cov121-Isochrysis_galbana.AAC.5